MNCMTPSLSVIARQPASINDTSRQLATLAQKSGVKNRHDGYVYSPATPSAKYRAKGSTFETGACYAGAVSRARNWWGNRVRVSRPRNWRTCEWQFLARETGLPSKGVVFSAEKLVWHPEVQFLARETGGTEAPEAFGQQIGAKSLWPFPGLCSLATQPHRLSQFGVAARSAVSVAPSLLYPSSSGRLLPPFTAQSRRRSEEEACSKSSYG